MCEHARACVGAGQHTQPATDGRTASETPETRRNVVAKRPRPRIILHALANTGAVASSSERVHIESGLGSGGIGGARGVHSRNLLSDLDPPGGDTTESVIAGPCIRVPCGRSVVVSLPHRVCRNQSSADTRLSWPCHHALSASLNSAAGHVRAFRLSESPLVVRFSGGRPRPLCAWATSLLAVHGLERASEGRVVLGLLRGALPFALVPACSEALRR